MNDMWRDPGGWDPEDLHRRLADAVEPVRPGPDSLNRLRRRVTARRRQRQAMVAGGAATAITSVMLAAVLAAPGGVGPGGGDGAGLADSSESGGTEHESSQQAAGTRTWPGAPPPGVHPIPPPTTAETSPPRSSASTGSSPSPTASPSATKSPSPTRVPSCAPADLGKTDKQALVSSAEASVGYGFVELVNEAARSCTVTGPPHASVVDASTGADAGFSTEARSASDSPKLAEMTHWGRTLVLKPRQVFRFQFAWSTKAADADTPCAGAESADTSRTWAVRYQLDSSGPALAQVSLPVACKGTLYVTDVYRPGEYSEAFVG